MVNKERRRENNTTNGRSTRVEFDLEILDGEVATSGEHMTSKG
jgi:hypothetical protein